MNVAQCCNRQDLVTAAIPVFGIHTPAAVCRNCGDLLSDESGIWRLLAPIIGLVTPYGWDGSVHVADPHGLRTYQ